MPKQKARPEDYRMGHDHRLKIKNSNILNALIEHVEGVREMSSTQVQAGLGLLKKVMPDTTFNENVNRNGDLADFIEEIRERGLTIHNERGSNQGHSAKPH